MPTRHKNKTLTALLAALLGAFGMHRFYLHGKRDFSGWAHALTVPLSLLLLLSRPDQPAMFSALPFIVSVLAGLVAALVIGLTQDEEWDGRHNPGNGQKSDSAWPLAILLVLVFGVGAVGLIAAIARTFDLLFTGGAYG